MAKCTLCGQRLPGGFFADHPTDAAITKELCKCSRFHLELDASITNYCQECIAYVRDIKTGPNFDLSYKKMKQRIPSETGFFSDVSAECIKNYLNKIYSERKSQQKQLALNEYVEKKWALITEKYGNNFVFPNDEKQKHMCATKAGDVFILVENSRFGFNKIGQYKINANTKSNDYFFKLDTEALFAISLIPYENIIHYQSEGNLEHTTVVSGGGAQGGGVNLQGAAMGAMLFGGAGAIVGSQIGTEVVANPVKSKIVEHDQRKTILTIKNENGQVETRELPYYYSEVFMKVIPEKEFGFIQTSSVVREKPTEAAPNMVEEMKQIKELLDLGLITQEEFEAKKRQILDL